MDESSIRANPIQKRLMTEFCEKEFAAQVQHLTEFYGLENYHPQLTCNHSIRAAASYGGELIDGEPFVVLALKNIHMRVGDTRLFHFDEYNFLRDKPGIGDGEANWKKWCAWLIAHELSHTVAEIERFRAAASRVVPKEYHRDRRDHGRFWQAVYYQLRCNFCVQQEEKGCYDVEFIDFSDLVHHSIERCNGVQRITIYRGTDEVGFYIRQDGKLYKSNRSWRSKRLTKHRNVREIKAKLQ